MAEGKIDNALEEVKNIMENKREDWVCHSQAIAATYVGPDGGTWHDTTSAG